MTSVSLDESYRLCRKIARQSFSKHSWLVSNLPRDRKRHVHALAAFLSRAIELLDVQVSAKVRREEWSLWRDELRDALRGKDCKPELVALVDTVEQFEISREYLFDIQAGVEMGIRCQKIDAFDQWMQLGSRIGGSFLLASVPIVGFDEPGYETAAMACGEAVFLTQLIDEMGSGIQKVMHYAPRLEAEKYGVELDALNPRDPGKPFCRFVRRLVSKVEPLYADGGKLVKYLSFDGKRVFRSVVAMHWQLLMKMKGEPEGVLQNKHQLTRKDVIGLQMKHLMGLEGGVPALEDADADHHH